MSFEHVKNNRENSLNRTLLGLMEDQNGHTSKHHRNHNKINRAKSFVPPDIVSNNVGRVPCTIFKLSADYARANRARRLPRGDGGVNTQRRDVVVVGARRARRVTKDTSNSRIQSRRWSAQLIDAAQRPRLQYMQI